MQQSINKITSVKVQGTIFVILLATLGVLSFNSYIQGIKAEAINQYKASCVAVGTTSQDKWLECEPQGMGGLAMYIEQGCTIYEDLSISCPTQKQGGLSDEAFQALAEEAYTNPTEEDLRTQVQYQ